MRLNKTGLPRMRSIGFMPAFMSAARPSLKNRAVESPSLGTNNERNKTVKFGCEIGVVFLSLIVVTNLNYPPHRF